MSDRNELERIMEDFELEIESGDSPNAQSERLESLHKEGKLTDEEFELLRAELVNSNKSPLVASETSDDQEQEPTDWLPEETVSELVSLFKLGIKDSDPYSDEPSYHSIMLQIASLPSGAEVSIGGLGYGSAPCAVMAFSEREHEERFREHVTQNAPYEIEVDFSDDSQAPQMGVSFNVIPGGYDGELSEEDVMTEINHLFRMIAHTYGLTMSEISAGSITASGRE